MGRILILGGVFSVPALAIGFLAGILYGFGWISFVTHVALAVPGVLLVMFSQIMTLMYFAGTGSQVRKAVKAGEPLMDELLKARALRKAVSPWALGSLFLVMAATILAGGVHTGVLPDVVHWGLATLAVGVTVIAVYREILCIDENERLLTENDEIISKY